MGLPSLEDFKSAPSPVEREGKGFLEYLARKFDQTALKPSPSANGALILVAWYATEGATNQLIGQTISLTNVSQLGESESGSAMQRILRVSRFLSEGPFEVVVEIEDEQSKERFALSILYIPSAGIENINEQMSRLLKMVQQEEKSADTACGHLEPALVADYKGLDVPLFSTEIMEFPKIACNDTTCVLQDVMLMDRLHGDLTSLT